MGAIASWLSVPARTGGETIERKKNAAEAALKIWRHPSMKESLLAAGSITGITRLIHYKIDN